MRYVTRKLEFDSGHRLVGHETKCRNLHGHRYIAEISVGAEALDNVGRVLDFGEIKRIVGGWIDSAWDHGMILNSKDVETIALCRSLDSKVYILGGGVEPSVENMITELAEIAQRLLDDEETGIIVTHVRLYETPNCWADWWLEGHGP